MTIRVRHRDHIRQDRDLGPAHGYVHPYSEMRLTIDDPRFMEARGLRPEERERLVDGTMPHRWYPVSPDLIAAFAELQP